MHNPYFISNYVKIKNSQILKNGEKVFTSEEISDALLFSKEAYKSIGLNYPKYHKMDLLCKIGILGTSVLLKDVEYNSETALVLSNASSSLNTDLKHQHLMRSIVSPAVFVYTLPNIVLGEISIKFGLQSENAFLIEDSFNPELLFEYSSILLNSNKASSVVCGWIELKNDEYDVFLCLVSALGKIPFRVENLEKLYLFENE